MRVIESINAQLSRDEIVSELKNALLTMKTDAAKEIVQKALDWIEGK